MSMFNDIDWTRKGNDGIGVSNSESQGGHWTFLGLGDEKKWYGTHPYTSEGKWDSTATQMERFQDTGQQVFKSISALSRGILKKKKGRDTVHFNVDASNTELLFRNIHSVNWQRIFGAVTKWCEPFVRDQKCIGMCEITRSKTFGIPPELVSGNSLRENIQDFESLTKTIRFTKVRTCNVPAQGISWDEPQKST